MQQSQARPPCPLRPARSIQIRRALRASFTPQARPSRLLSVVLLVALPLILAAAPDGWPSALAVALVWIVGAVVIVADELDQERRAASRARRKFREALSHLEAIEAGRSPSVASPAGADPVSPARPR